VKSTRSANRTVTTFLSRRASTTQLSLGAPDPPMEPARLVEVWRHLTRSTS
jgi:hypothetical protein